MLWVLSSRLYSRTRQYPTEKGKLLTEHLILSVCPDFVLSRAPQFPRQKHTSENLFYRTAPSGCFRISVIFLEREKQKKIFIAPEVVVLRCSVKKDVLKNFTKFTGKHLCQSLSFNKVVGLRLWRKCFPVNIVKISWTPFLKKTSGGWLYSSSVLDTLENL